MSARITPPITMPMTTHFPDTPACACGLVGSDIARQYTRAKKGCTVEGSIPCSLAEEETRPVARSGRHAAVEALIVIVTTPLSRVASAQLVMSCTHGIFIIKGRASRR